jgi:hypothetical protein
MMVAPSHWSPLHEAKDIQGEDLASLHLFFLASRHHEEIAVHPLPTNWRSSGSTTAGHSTDPAPVHCLY